jgi:hypothetical protein
MTARMARIRPHLQNKALFPYAFSNVTNGSERPRNVVVANTSRDRDAENSGDIGAACASERLNRVQEEQGYDGALSGLHADGALPSSRTADTESAYDVHDMGAHTDQSDGYDAQNGGKKQGNLSDKEKHKVLMARGWRTGGVVKNPQAGVASVALEQRWWVSPDKRKFEGLNKAWAEHVRCQAEVRRVSACACARCRVHYILVPYAQVC